jgi:TonB family protein
MKRFYLSLIVFLVLDGFALTIQAQSGRVRNETRAPSDTGPFSETLNKPPEQKITKQEQDTFRPGSVRIDWPALVNGERIYRPREVDSKAIVIKKPAAVFVQEARKRAIEGTVVLRAIFNATGKVTDITVISGVSYELTESAIKAARKIKFQPALKDGKAVSMWVQLEYQFTLY